MSNRRAKYALKEITRSQALQVISHPLVTEKSMMDAENNKIWFSVPLTTTKPQVRLAVKKLFDVLPTAVNTRIVKGKNKRFRGKMTRRPDRKIAVVTLPEGKTIDVSAGV